MAGITRLIKGEVAQSKSKGKAFVQALNSALSPSAIASKKVVTQSTKGSKK